MASLPPRSSKMTSSSAADSKASTTWAFSPVSGVSTPTTVEALSGRRSSCESITPGKSLIESVVALSLIGLLSVLLAGLQLLVSEVIVANLAFVAGLFAYQWMQVHSYKLDPRCSIILDEANVLSITSNFDHEQLGFIQRFQPTAKPSESTEAMMKPKSLWDALFFDDRRYKIEEFYREMYGNEYSHAKKREDEEIAALKKRAAEAASEQRTQELSDDDLVQKTQEASQRSP